MSNLITVYIKPEEAFHKPVLYMLGVLAQTFDLQIKRVAEVNEAIWVWDNEHPQSQSIAQQFYELLPDQLPHFSQLFDNECVLKNALGQPDYLATAFYLMQCLQEYGAKPASFDRHGRFKYQASVQHHFEMVEENLVYRCLENFLKQNHVPLVQLRSKCSKLFLSYDIDGLFGAWKTDGLAALRRHDYALMFNILQAHFIHREPGWLNIDKLLKIHDEYGLKATFFWLINRDKAPDGTPNADYDVQSSKVRRLIHMVSDSGHTNGLHKSISLDTHRTEADQLPTPVIINRNHYLRLKLPQFWEAFDKSGLKIDASLGFAEQHGFRNSFALPFQPYNFLTGRPYDFIELPLHTMDTTFYTYKQDYSLGMSKTIIDFMEKHRQNAILSLLWHNVYFTNVQFQRHLDNFKAVMSYCKEQGWQSITPNEIYNNYYKPPAFWDLSI